MTCRWWLFWVAALPTVALARGSAGERALYESQRIVDMPTAGVLPRQSMLIRAIAFERGGILAEALVSPLSNVQIGIGYSGIGVVGDDVMQWQGIPSLQFRWRFLDERRSFPACAIGIETLGRGAVTANAFATPAPGAFLVFSKQFRWMMGEIALHTGIGYSLDLRFNGQGLNGWIGFEQSLGRSVAVSLEANPQSLEQMAPLLLNMVVRWSILNDATLEFYLRDLLSHTAARPIRSAGIEFIVLLSQVVW